MAAARAQTRASTPSLFQARNTHAVRSCAPFLQRPVAALAHAVLWAAVAATATGLASKAQAQGTTSGEAAARRVFDIPAGQLDQALSRFGRQAGVQIAVNAELTAGLRSPGVNGSHAPAEALSILLAGTGLEALRDASGEYTLRRRAASAPLQSESASGVALPAVTVTASADQPGELPKPYAGGQVARGGWLGLLGNLDFMETPFSTTNYTEDYINDAQAKDIGSVIGATDASVYVPQMLGLHESFLIRGFRVSADDITFNGLAGMAPYQRGSTEMVERMEVLKGPSAMLKGMAPFGSVGGSVNMVPKRASDEPLTRLSANYASDAQFGLHADVGRRFGEHKQFGVRFNGVYRDGDTAVDNQQHRMALGSLGLDWRGERVRVSFDFYRQRERLDGIDYFGINSIARTVTRLPAPFKGDTNLAAPWMFNVSHTTAAMARAEWDITDKVMAYAAYGQRDSNYDALIAQNTLLNDAGGLSSALIRQYTMAKLHSAEIGLQGRLTTGPVEHTWSLAATNYDNKGGFRNIRGRSDADWLRRYSIYAPTFGLPPNLSSFSTDGVPYSSRNEMNGVALANRMSVLGDTVQLTLGVRRQSIKNTAIGATGVRYDGSTYDESAVSPSAALLVKLTPQWSVYGSHIQGLTQGGTAPIGTRNAGESLPPYKAKQHELGAKYDSGHLAVTAALFQIMMPSAYTNPTTNTYAANGEQRNRGLELNVFGEATRGLRVLGGVTWLDATLQKQLVPSNNGNQVTGVPKIIARLGAEYDIAAVPGLTLTGLLNHVGKRYATADNRLSLSPYTTLNVGARYATRVADKAVVLRASVDNLTNKAYWGGSWGGSGDSGLSGGLGAPRTVRASVSVDF